MKIVFAKGRSLGSYLIRFFTWSQWSHCGVLVGDWVVHASWPRGVHVEAMQSFAQRYPTHEIVTVSLPFDNEAGEWLMSQVGKPYDLSGMVDFVTHRDWQDPSRWFCSELIGAGLRVGGLRFAVPASRLTPAHLYLISSVREAVLQTFVPGPSMAPPRNT